MDFILSNIVLPIVLALIVGLPLSIYAGFICGRILIFEEIKNRISENIYMNLGPFESSSQITASNRNIEIIETIEQRLDKLGHKSASKVISEIISEIRSELSKLESDFIYCETRHKRDPVATMIENEIIKHWLHGISNMKPSLKNIAMPNLKI